MVSAGFSHGGGKSGLPGSTPLIFRLVQVSQPITDSDTFPGGGGAVEPPAHARVPPAHAPAPPALAFPAAEPPAVEPSVTGIKDPGFQTFTDQCYTICATK